MPGPADLGAFLAALDDRLESVLFDLDGTLRYTDPSPTTSLFDKAAELGVPDGMKKRRKIARWTHYYWAQSPELAEDSAAFPEERDFWLNYTVRSLLEYDCEPECARELAPELVRYMQEEYQSTNVIPSDVRPTLGYLKESGYRLALLSNRDMPCHAELSEWELDNYFELTLVAGQISAWKPDPGLFTHALDHLGVRPEKAIYVGDNYFADVIGARRAGVQPVLYDPNQVFTDADCPVIRRISELELLAAHR
jgi:putative hydrolase of the HAD superfamily